MNCPACGHENPASARFCMSCGTPLASQQPAGREERKVVTVFFADLVGFTGRAEQLDPEDVRAMLSPYYARLRSEIERFGGTVEKFIGDAVMAVFGAPVAHEDDPERAVRAALAIRDVGADERRRRRCRCGSRSTRARRSSSLDARPAGGRGDGRRRRRQHGRPAAVGRAGERHPRRRGDVPRDRARHRVPRGRAGRGEGKGGAGAGLGGGERRGRASASTSQQRGAAPLVGRGESSTCSTTPRARAPGARRRSWSRSSACPGSARAGSCASSRRRSTRRPELIATGGRAAPAIRRRRRLLGAGEMVKAQAGILETRLRRGGRGEAARDAVADLIPDADERALDREPPAPARRPRGGGRAERRQPRRGVRGLAPVLRGARRAPARSCSSSRTCTGPTTACSTSSTTSSTGRTTCRCSSSGLRGRSCSSGGRGGAAASRTRRRSRSRRSPRTKRRVCSPALLGAGRPACRAPGAAPGPRGRKPALRGGVRRAWSRSAASLRRTALRCPRPCRESSRRGSTRSRRRRRRSSRTRP